MDNNELKQLIDAEVNTNGHRGITGASLNGVLNAIVDTLGIGQVYGGLADGDDEPENDERYFYIRTKKGEEIWGKPYMNIEQDGIYILTWSDGAGRWMIRDLILSTYAIAILSAAEVTGRVLSDYNYEMLDDINKMRVVIGAESGANFRKKRMFYYSKEMGDNYYYVSPPESDRVNGFIYFYQMTISKTRGDGGYPYTLQKITASADEEEI